MPLIYMIRKVVVAVRDDIFIWGHYRSEHLTRGAQQRRPRRGFFLSTPEPQPLQQQRKSRLGVLVHVCTLDNTCAAALVIRVKRRAVAFL